MKTDKSLSQRFQKDASFFDNITGRNFVVVEACIDEIGGYPCIHCIGEDGITVGFDPNRLSEGRSDSGFRKKERVSITFTSPFKLKNVTNISLQDKILEINYDGDTVLFKIFESNEKAEAVAEVLRKFYRVNLNSTDSQRD